MGPEFVGVRLDTYTFHIRYKWFVFSSQTCQTLWLVLTKEQKRTVITRETHTHTDGGSSMHVHRAFFELKKRIT